MAEGLAHIATLAADFGGTEIMAPLQDVFGATSIDGYARTVFILTDGQVSNTTEVINLVRHHQKRVTVHSMGLGHGVSHALVDGIGLYVLIDLGLFWSHFVNIVFL